MEAAVNSEPTISLLEEASLVRSVQAGDVQAYGQLIVRYQDRVFNTVWRICRDPEDARDLTQEAFLKALRAIDRFQGQSAFYTWLFRIAVNLALSHRKKAKLRLVASLNEDRDDSGTGRPMSAAERIADYRTPAPARAAELAETRERVVAALDAIDEQHRAVIILRDIEGFDYQRIADVLEVKVGTIKSRVHRARAALQLELERTGESLTSRTDTKK